MGFNFSQFRKIFTAGIKISILTIALTLSFNVSAQIVYVDQTATGTGDGASWTNAMTDLQNAIDAAATVATVSSPLQVWVKAGTYYTTSGTDRTIGFELKDNVEVYGGFSGTETLLSQQDHILNTTILSGDIGVQNDNADNAYAIIYAGNDVSNSTLIDGFHITGASTLNEGTGAIAYGGVSMIGSAANLEINQCIISGNDASFGSGISTVLSGNASATLRIVASKIHNNSRSITGANAIWITRDLEIYNSLIYDNGGQNAFLRQGGNVIFSGVTFFNNSGTAYFQHQTSGTSAQIYNSIFWKSGLFVESAAVANTVADNNLVEGGFGLGTVIDADPQFFDEGTFDLRITHCSPAVNAGSNFDVYSGSSLDYGGDPRIFGSSVDLGAYESQIPPVFFSAVEVGNAKCNKGSSGQISVNGAGGTGAPITYGLDGVNFSSNAIFENLSAGNYTVYATDGVCVYSEEFTVTEPTEIDINLSVTSGTTSNTLDVIASGGAGLFQYSTDGTNYQSSGTFSITNGQITAYVKDANNCVESKTISVSADGRVVVYINLSATGSGDGSSWADAHTDLQTAINTAGNLVGASGEAEVWVKSSTYYPVAQSSTDRTQTIQLRNNVLVYGGFSGMETQRSQRDIKNNLTILSGDIGVANDSTDNSYGIVTAGADIVDFATIDGFQLQGAFSLGVEPTNGAVHMIGNVGEVNIKNCTFIYNLANEGACIRTSGVTNTTSKVTVESSEFFNNGFYATSTYIGSAINIKNEINVYNSLFIENSSGVGGVFYINATGGQLSVVNSTFYANGAGNSGSVFYNGFSNSNTSVSWDNNINWGSIGPGFEFLLGPISVSALSFRNSISSEPLFGNDTSNIYENPQFFDESTYDLRVKHCSPAVDAGDGTKLPSGASVDLNGNPRQFNAVDIGAYENQITPISISLISKTDVSCNGFSDGEVEVSATGGAGASLAYSIDGSTFSSTAIFSGLAVGNHTIYVSDPGNGCVVTETYTITEPAVIGITASLTDVSCNGLNDGVIAGSISGGTAPYQIFLSGTLMETGVTSSFTVDNLPPAVYTLSVTDDNGCSLTFSSSLTIAEPAVLSATNSSVNVLCNGDATGEITVTSTGGIAPYEYSIDGTNFQSGNIFTSLVADSYTVTIRDDNGCETTANQNVTEPTALTEVAISASHVSCNGASDGSFSIEGSGGTTPYEYSLDGTAFQTSPLWENLVADSYTLTIRDSNGCVRTTAWTVTEPGVLSATALITGTTSCGLSDGGIDVTVVGGTSPYLYSLDGGTTTQGSSVFSGLIAGTYSISITDDNGCAITLNESINDPVTATVTTTQIEVQCNGDASGSLNVSVSGGTTPIAYSLNGGAPQSGSSFANLTAGSYTVEVKEANGCSQTVTATISEPSALTGTITMTDLTCFEAGDGAISVASAGGTGPIEYSIDGTNFQSENTFAGLSAGSYDVTIMDANNCTYQISASISEPLEVQATAATINASCTGSLDGSIAIAVTNGVAPLSFSLDGGATQSGNVFDQLDPGTYSVSVTDANGCGSVLTGIVVGASTTIVPSLTKADVLCNGEATGEVSVTASGGTTPYEYSIDGTTFQSASTFNNLIIGIYTVTTRDADGCTGTEEITITEPPVLAVSVAQNNKSFVIAATGGSSPYEYSLDGTNFQSSSNFNDLDFGNYTFTVRDANGCTIESDEFSIVLGLSSNENRIGVYPNPASDYLLVSSDKVAMVQIFDLNGKIQQQHKGTGSIDIQDLEKGVYVLLLLDDKGQVLSTNRLLKE